MLVDKNNLPPHAPPDGHQYQMTLTEKDIIEYSDLIYARHRIRLSKKEALESALSLVGFVKAVTDNYHEKRADK